MRTAQTLWSHALVAGLLLIGCKSNKEPEPAPAAKPAVPAPAPVPTVAPVTDATLSYLSLSAEGRCLWIQHTPPGEPRTVTTLPTECESVRLAWSLDGKEGLASARTQEGKVLLWRVDLATGKTTALSIPTLGELGAMGFDASGRPLALMEDERRDDGKQEMLFEGQRYPVTAEGIPGLAHAFRLEGSEWKRVETKATSYGWDYASETRALTSYEELGPTPEKLRTAGEAAFKPVPEGSAALAALDAVQRTTEEGGWKQLELPGGPLYAWESAEGEFPYLTTPVRVLGPRGPVAPEELHLTGAFLLMARGPLALVDPQGGEDKPQALLWNAQTRKLVATVNDKRTVSFWPKPSSASH